MLQGPCKVNGVECTERKLGCHQDCEKYEIFKAKREKLRRLKMEANEKETDYMMVIRRRHRR